MSDDLKNERKIEGKLNEQMGKAIDEAANEVDQQMNEDPFNPYEFIDNFTSYTKAVMKRVNNIIRKN